MEFMQTHWENMANEAKFADLCPAIECGLQALGKYYTLTDDTPVYVICLGETLWFFICILQSTDCFGSLEPQY